jgi:hypothetical protein
MARKSTSARRHQERLGFGSGCSAARSPETVGGKARSRLIAV